MKEITTKFGSLVLTRVTNYTCRVVFPVAGEIVVSRVKVDGWIVKAFAASREGYVEPMNDRYLLVTKDFVACAFGGVPNRKSKDEFWDAAYEELFNNFHYDHRITPNGLVYDNNLYNPLDQKMADAWEACDKIYGIKRK